MQDAAGIVERLLGFLEIGKPHVTAESLIQIKDLLRRYPDIADVCISSISFISPVVIPPSTAHAVSQGSDERHPTVSFQPASMQSSAASVS